MTILLIAITLIPASAFFLCALVRFRQEVTTPRWRNAEHMAAIPFCIACTEGWTHNPNLGSHRSPAAGSAELSSRVMVMPRTGRRPQPKSPVLAKVKRPETRGAA